MSIAKKNLVTICVVVFFWLFVSVPCVFARSIVSGVEYFTETTSSGKPVRIVTVNTQQALIRVEGKGSACNTPYRPADFESLVNEPDFVAAINASFFTGGNVAQSDYVGNRIHIGQEKTNKFVAVDHAGNISNGEGALDPSQAGNYSMYLNGIFRLSTTGSNFTTVTDSEIRERFASIYPAHSQDELDSTTGSFNATGPIHRTFLGINPAEHKMILMVAGGYALTGDHARLGGIVPIEAVQLLKRYGATEGYLLDGGGSSLMRLNSRLTGGDGGSNSDGRGIADLVVVRTGTPQTQAQVAALPTVRCGSGSGAGSSTSSGTTVGSGTTTQPVTSGPSVSVPPGSVPLEVPIGSVGSISGEGSIIVNYSRVLFAFLAGLIGLIALAMLIISGLRIMAGGSDQMTKGKEGIVGVLSGLMLFASGGLLLYFINPCFFTFGESAVCQTRITSTGQRILPSGGGMSAGTSGVSSGPQSSTSASPSEYRSALPSVWAQGKRSMGLGRFNQFGTEFTRQVNIVFPGVAPELLMGFALNGGQTENTTAFVTGLSDEHRPEAELPDFMRASGYPNSLRCAPSRRPSSGEWSNVVLRQTFHELGMFGVEGGPRCGPAPGAAGTANNNWTPLATDTTVQSILGRPGCTDPGCWRNLEDQLAIGLVRIRNAARSVNRLLPESIRAQENSLYFVALGFAGWSAGGGRAANQIRLFERQLAAVPQEKRWGEWIKQLATSDIHASSGRQVKYGSPYWTAVRTLQKIEGGLVLATARNGNTAFFEDGLGSERSQIQEVITQRAVLGY